MRKTWNIFLYILLGIGGIWLCAVLLFPVGLPFLIGFLLSRLAEPLRPKSWKRTPAAIFSVSLVFAAFCLLLWFLGKTLFNEGEQLARQLPGLLDRLSDPLSQLYASSLRLASKLPDSFAPAAAEWVEKFFAGSSILIQSLSERLLSLAASILAKIPNLLMFVFTALLSAYLFSVDQSTISSFLCRHVPEKWRSRGEALLRKLKGALGGYLKAQLSLSGVCFLIALAGLLILRRPNVFLWALVIGLIDALPVFGAGTVLIPWGLLSLLWGDTLGGIGLLVLYGIIAITRTVLEPRFIGKQMGLHPLLTLVALYAGFRLFGIAGMILLPIGVILLQQLYTLSLDF